MSILFSLPQTDQEWSYVAVSRLRQRLWVFVPEGAAEELEYAVGMSRQKGLASDYGIVPVVPVAPVVATACKEAELELG